MYTIKVWQQKKLNPKLLRHTTTQIIEIYCSFFAFALLGVFIFHPILDRKGDDNKRYSTLPEKPKQHAV